MTDDTSDTSQRPDGADDMERSRARWARVQAVFHDALERPDAEREAFVRAACDGDPEMVDEVLELIVEDGLAHAVLDGDIARVADGVLRQTAPPGDAIGPYRIVRELGRGGMGVVYLAERPDIGLLAAVKVLQDASLSPARRARFVSEQRTLASLVHPGVARLYDADLLPDETPYFVMEYVPGATLDRHCAERNVGVRARLRLARAICEAVAFAHGRAVIHRDLKPSNVMVTEDGAPKLLDFGIAKHLGEDTVGGPEVTRTSLRMMTPAYAAPEQLLGEPIGVYTDVYALGVMIYELITGRLPYDLTTLTPAQAERTVTETDPAWPSSAWRDGAAGAPPDIAGVSRAEWSDLDVLCSTAMHRDVTRRYPSAEALGRDIDHFLAGTPLEARPDSTAYRMSKFARRNRRALAIGAAVVAGFVSTGTFYAWSLADARDRALAEAERTRRIQAFTENLFRGGDEAAGPADTLRVLTLLDRGVEEARLLTMDPSAQSDLYLTLGTIYGQLGRFDEADSLLSGALDLRASIDDGDRARIAEVQVARAELRTKDGAYTEAEAILRPALATLEAQRPRDDLAIARVRASLGVALEGQGDFEPAISFLEQAIDTYERRRRGSVEHAQAIGALAATHFYAGHLDTADSLNHRAIALDRVLHGDVHPTIADSYINLAAAEAQRGRYREAEVLFRDALHILEAYHGPDHPETASALRMLGSNLIYQARLEEARPLVERALAIQERTLSPDHPRLANTMGDLAYLRLDAADYDEAIRLYERIVDIYRATNGDRHYFVAIGLSNLANAYMTAGRLAESETIFRDVVARFAESRGADHLDTGIARIKLGRVLLRQGRASEAEGELLAGYELVKAQAAPTVSWLRAAREDLVGAYEALSRPDRAEFFRREQAALDSASSST